MVDDIDEGSKRSDDLENEYDGIQNVEITGSNNHVGDNDDTANQDDTLTLRFIEKCGWDMAREKTMNCKQPTKKRLLEVSASKIVDNTIGLEKAVSPAVYRIKTKIWATDASGAMNLKNYKERLNAIESKLRSTRASDVAVVLMSVLNIPQKVSSTRWTFKVKSDCSFTAR